MLAGHSITSVTHFLFLDLFVLCICVVWRSGQAAQHAKTYNLKKPHGGATGMAAQWLVAHLLFLEFPEPSR